MKSPSIKLRIQVAVITLIVTTLSMASIILYLRIQKTFKIQTERDLAHIAVLVAREIEVNGDMVVDDWYSDILKDRSSTQRSFIQSWGPQGIKTQRSPALGKIDLPRFHGELGEFVYRDVTLPHHNKMHQARAVGLLVIPSSEGLNPNDVNAKKLLQPHVLVVALDTEQHKKFLDRLQWGIVLTILGLTFYSYLIVHFILKSALLPIEKLAVEIRKTHSHQLDSGFIISPHFPVELKDLVIQYNELISRVENSRTREKNFSSYVAHELRTPLAGISMTLEQALNQPREASFYKKSISEAIEITDSMQRLIERLKNLTLLQNKEIQVESETIDLHYLLHHLWQEFEPIAEKHSLKVVWNLEASDALVRTDQQLSYILVSNLGQNAVTYATPQTSIHIETRVVNDRLQLSILNQTSELTSSDIQFLFDPFFRKDKARSIDGHHFGMGLSICQEISHVLQADLEASVSKSGQFTIQCSFPLAESF